MLLCGFSCLLFLNDYFPSIRVSAVNYRIWVHVLYGFTGGRRVVAGRHSILLQTGMNPRVLATNSGAVVFPLNLSYLLYHTVRLTSGGELVNCFHQESNG